MLSALRRRYREALITQLEFDEQGLRCLRGRGMLRPPRLEARAWAQIDTVTVFKADALTTDCICVVFEGAEAMLVVDETMSGYQTLIEHLPQVLPGALPFEDWFLTVAFPAFAPNPTVIYRRLTLP